MTTNTVSRKVAWLRVVTLAIAAFIFNTTEFAPVGLLSDIADSFGMETAQVGMMLTIYAWVVALMSLPFMLLTSKVERRRLLIGLFILFIASHVLSFFAWNFDVLVISRIGIAFAHAVFWSITSALAIRMAPPGKRAQALSLIATGTALAMVFGIPIGRIIGQYFGWRMTFLVTALVGIPVLLAQIFLLPRLTPEKAIQIRDLPALFINPQARVGLIAVLLIGLAHFAAYTYVAPFFKHSSGFDGPTIGSLLLLYGVAGVLGNVFAGFAANRSVRNTLLLVALMIGTSTALFPYFATGMTGAVVLIALWGFAFGAFPACASIWMFVVAPKDVERGMPLFVALFQVIIALGSFFGGRIVDQMGSAVLLSLATVLVGLGFATVLVLGRKVSNSLVAQPA